MSSLLETSYTECPNSLMLTNCYVLRIWKCLYFFLIRQFGKNYSSVVIFFVGCRIKIHKEHLERKDLVDRKEDNVPPCKLHYDPSYAKELLLLALSNEEQKHWVTRLSKKIQKYGFKANNTFGMESAKISPR